MSFFCKNQVMELSKNKELGVIRRNSHLNSGWCYKYVFEKKRVHSHTWEPPPQYLANSVLASQGNTIYLAIRYTILEIEEKQK